MDERRLKEGEDGRTGDPPTDRPSEKPSERPANGQTSPFTTKELGGHTVLGSHEAGNSWLEGSATASYNYAYAKSPSCKNHATGTRIIEKGFRDVVRKERHAIL